MRYDFQNKTTGEVRAFNFPMREAPALDSEMQADGDTWVRIVSPEAGIATDGFSGAWAEGMSCPSLPVDITGRKCKKGFALVENAREARNIASRLGLAWE